MSARALAVAMAASQAIETLSSMSAERSDDQLRPAIHQAAHTLQKALRQVEKTVCNGHALPDPLGALKATEGCQAQAAAISEPVVHLNDEETEHELRVESAWDPDTTFDHIEADRCRALLLEMVRRAAHDWVLYRQHERLKLKELANNAYVWLFEEAPGHAWWDERNNEGRMITAFLVICDELDLDPEVVRTRVRKMTVKDIMSAGRPAERRHRRTQEDVHYADHGVAVSFDVVGAGDSPLRSSYENAFAVSTPAYL